MLNQAGIIQNSQIFDRPLNNRGKRDLLDMANRLTETPFKIDQFLSSPAKRALTTAISVMQKPLVFQNPKLYRTIVFTMPVAQVFEV